MAASPEARRSIAARDSSMRARAAGASATSDVRARATAHTSSSVRWLPSNSSMSERLTCPAAGGNQLLDVHQPGRVIAGIAGVAVFVLGIAHRLAQGIEREIAQRIRLHETPDLFRGLV